VNLKSKEDNLAVHASTQ